MSRIYPCCFIHMTKSPQVSSLWLHKKTNELQYTVQTYESAIFRAASHGTTTVNIPCGLYITQTLLLPAILYIGLVQYPKATDVLFSLHKINLAWFRFIHEFSCIFPFLSLWQFYPIPWQPYLPKHNIAHSPPGVYSYIFTYEHRWTLLTQNLTSYSLQLLVSCGGGRWPMDGLCQQLCSHQPNACVGHSRGFFQHFDYMTRDGDKYP
jgi:hypothetical protein